MEFPHGAVDIFSVAWLPYGPYFVRGGGIPLVIL